MTATAPRKSRLQTIRVSPDARAPLEKAARADDRPLTAWGGKVALEATKQSWQAK